MRRRMKGRVFGVFGEGGSAGKEEVPGHVMARENSGREAGFEGERSGRDREPEVGCTQLDGAGVQEDGYMSLDPSKHQNVCNARFACVMVPCD